MTQWTRINNSDAYFDKDLISSAYVFPGKYWDEETKKYKPNICEIVHSKFYAWLFGVPIVETKEQIDYMYDLFKTPPRVKLIGNGEPIFIYFDTYAEAKIYAETFK